ncbi:MAG: IS110 family transposase [Gammaproteobacteria bacterium]
MNSVGCVIGVDVAKAEVVVAVLGEPGVVSLANETEVLRAWLARLPAGSCLALESTGGYHRRLAELAHGRGLTVYLLNPQDVCHYARALGRRAKTDRVDAELLARYLAQEHGALHPWEPPSPAQERIARLLKRRAKLVVARGMLRASLADLEELESERAAVLKGLMSLQRAMEQELAHAIAALPEGRTRFAQLCSIPGIGPLSGAALTELFSRVRFARSDAAVAYAGLDPRARDSGQRRGRRHLSKRGPAQLRCLLFNAAMSAARTPTWKPFYERQRAKGLSSTAALVVLARKLMRVAYALDKHHTTFDPRFAGA